MSAQIKHIAQASYNAEERREIAAFFRQLIAGGVKTARIAHESGISEAALAAFLGGGDDLGSCNALDGLYCTITAAAESTGFVHFPSNQQIIDALERARSPRVGLNADKSNSQRGIALIFGAAGFGKTTTVEWYAEQENRYQGINKIPVLLIEVPGGWGSRKVMFEAIAKALHEKGYSRNWEDAEASITAALPYGGIIVFDQAHRLSKARLDELSYFTDQLSIAVALVGNLTGYVELQKKQLDSITRRVNGKPVHLVLPTEEDILAILANAKISGSGIVDHANLFGIQACGIDYLFKTIHAAKLLAAANGVGVDLELFKLASVLVGAWSEQT